MVLNQAHFLPQMTFGVSDLPPMNVRFYTFDYDLTSIPAGRNNQIFPVNDF